MEKILVSACLLGENTKYDGTNSKAEILEEYRKRFDLVPFCPEMEGGLPTPRPPAEIRNGRVKTKDGTDVSSAYRLGAEKALNLCRFLGIKLAILKEKSPACGPHLIHSGYFDGRVKAGEGVTASYLKMHGIEVISEEEAVIRIAEIIKQEELKNESTRLAKEKEAQKEEEEKANEGEKVKNPKPYVKSFKPKQGKNGKKFFRSKPKGKFKGSYKGKSKAKGE